MSNLSDSIKLLGALLRLLIIRLNLINKMNTAEKSRILLLNLGLDTDKTAIKKVTVKELKEIFGKYGHLKKIVVFTRKTLLKAFLEYRNFEEAEAAINAVHETFVSSYGKARLYFSPMQVLKFSNKYLEFWEDDEDKQVKSDDELSTKLSLQYSVFKSPTKLLFQKENNQNLMQNVNSNFKTYPLFSDNPHTYDLISNKESLYHIKNSIYNSKYSISNTFSDTGIQAKANQQEHIANETKPVKLYNNGSVLSKVVLVSNLGYIFKNAEELFNIFSAFGNITKILFMSNLQKALVEYTEIKYASECITNLNNLTLGDTKLRISFSKYKTIDLLKNNKTENSLQHNQVLIIPPTRNRYNPTFNSIIPPLSTTLLISYPRIGRVQSIDVYLAIEKFCKPVKTKLVNSKAFIGASDIVSMLFSFEDIQSAVYVMYKCHNNVIKGAILDVFFF